MSVATEFEMKVGDLPTITTTLKDGDGNAVDVTSGDVTFTLRELGTDTAKVAAATATKVTPASGIVSYTFTGTDTDTAGVYAAYWEHSDLTYPSQDWDIVVIVGDTIIGSAYASLAEARHRFGITTTRHDAELYRAMEVASRQIDRYCGRRFYGDTSATARTYTAEYGDELIIEDVHTTTGFVLATDHNDDQTYEQSWTLDGTGSWAYWLEPLNPQGWPYTRIRVDNGYLPTAPRAVQVTAQWGWAAVPPEIAEACLVQAGRVWKRKDMIFGMMGSTEFGFTRLPQGLDGDVKHLVGPYRRAVAYAR